MADIPNATQNVSIYDETGNVAEVNSSNELLVHDTHNSTDGDRWQTVVKEGRAFFTIGNFTTIAGQAETDFFLLTNPAGSGKIIYFETLVYTYNKGAGVSVVRIYRDPTITANGTSFTIQKVKPTSTFTTVLSAYTAPTISARGTLRQLLGQSAVGSLIYHEDLGFMLEPNHSTLFTIQPAANNTDHALYLEWEEQ